MDVIGNRNLRWLIEKKVKDYADKEFIVFEDRLGNVHRYTYAEFDEVVNKYANILNGLGIKKGDKVNVHLLNSPEYLFSWFAIAKLGAVMIPTNVLSGGFEMEYFLNFADCVAIITEPYYMDMYKGILDKCPDVKNVLLARTSPLYPNKKLYPDAIIIQDMLKDAATDIPEVDIDPEDDLMMLFTSGTTSRPKAVQLTHANAVFAGIFGAQGYKIVSEDRHFMVLPLFHVNAQFISVCLGDELGPEMPHRAGVGTNRQFGFVRICPNGWYAARHRIEINTPGLQIDLRTRFEFNACVLIKPQRATIIPREGQTGLLSCFDCLSIIQHRYDAELLFYARQLL